MTGPRFRTFLGKHVHMGVTGSIAAYKALDFLRMLQDSGARVSVSLSEAATRFITPLAFEALGGDPVFCSMFDRNQASYGHLYPAQNADTLVVAPATANILAKTAQGIADDLLSCQALAFCNPIVFAPAMNVRMWRAPVTQANVATLRDRGHFMVGPDSGSLACGEEGEGRLADLESIYYAVLRQLSPQDMAGKTVLVTLGPTREYWDGIRFWSNPSSGFMGLSLAIAAWLRGADVIAVHGPLDFDVPVFLQALPVTSAQEMCDACMVVSARCDIACFTAAVADMAPEYQGAEKQKKEKHGQAFTLPFTSTPDVAVSFGQQKRQDQHSIIFAAETSQVESFAANKLEKKNADLVVGNLVNEPGSGFGVATNTVHVRDRMGRCEYWPNLPKPEVAWRIWDWLALL